MARLLVGIALLPTSAVAVWAASEAVLRLTSHGAAWPFLAGMAASAALWAFFRYGLETRESPGGRVAALATRLHVLAHELTHAVAAWTVGAKVLDLKVGEDGGHVDLSHSNAFVALAPYCVPFYTLAVVGGYRALLYFKPAVGGRGPFLALMGASIAFHLVKTFESLWDVEQPDLPAAGGVVFSLSIILLANAVVVLALVKALFPAAVDAGAAARLAASRSKAFWLGLYGLVAPLRRTFVAQLKKP